jgi:hypothetical protein
MDEQTHTTVEERGPEVEGHMRERAFSDERLKEAIAQTASALAALRALQTEGEDDVEGHPSLTPTRR